MLRVDGDRIVEADAPGLERGLAGLTLLEAAAVSGDVLATDALANALAPVFRAEPRAGRTAVAMSGGVDSAVALLRAGRDAVGVTLRLWLDPEGPDAERACCSPESVLQARETCHRLGLPHVTLDMREEFRAAVVAPFVHDYARGETPNPCIRCNGTFRFGELLAFAARAGCDRLATGHYARIVEHRGRRLLARGADPQKDQSYMLARVDPNELERVWFPLGEQDKAETRRGRARWARRRASRREPGGCFLAGDDYRTFLTRHGLEPKPARSSTSEASPSGSTTGSGATRPGSARARRRGRAAAFVLGADAQTNTVRVGPRSRLHARTSQPRGASTSTSTGPKRSSATVAGVPAASAIRRLRLDLTSRPSVSRLDRRRASTTATPVGCGLVSSGGDN